MLVLGLGVNVGDRAGQLRRAIARLSRGSGAILRGARVSRVYESPALMPEGAPAAWDLPFLNCAILGETSLDPKTVLARIQEIERSLGRPDHERWAPRPIDIDILWWEGHEMRAPHLTVPHPHILSRSFVLEPLCDLIPDTLIEGETIAVHARRLASTGTTRAVASPEATFKVTHPALMGILNVTPDSFSDGGRFLDRETAIAHARQLVADGADIIDVGAESTRPDGAPVDAETEWNRLEPVLEGLHDLRRELPGRFRISLDSRNPGTVRAGLRKGIDIINDVSGFTAPAMLEIAQESDAHLVFMHSLSVPVVKGESLPVDCDPVEALITWARDRLREFDRRKVARHRLVFDPGIGFGKTLGQNWDILKGVERFHDLETAILIGHSRKSFLASVTSRPSADRDEATLQVSRNLVAKGVDILRVHNVEAHATLLRGA